MTDLSPSDLARALAGHRRQVPGRCLRCGRPFVGTGKRRYCSTRCQSAATSAAYRKTRRTPPPAPEHT